jgi:predicted transcriptional regulator
MSDADHPSTDLRLNTRPDPWPGSPRGTPPETSPEPREKLTAIRVVEMRDLVEGTSRSYKSIGAELGVSASTVSRYAVAGGWRRPPGAALPARIARQRDKVTEKLWKLTARHVETLKEQSFELTQRSLQPLASLTRVLGDLSPQAASASEPEPDDLYVHGGRPTRTIHELRDELAAHLARVEREEGEHWERFDWFFRDGAGI